MTNIELKPCPCCGGPAEVTRYNPDDGYQDTWTRYYVECAECGLRTSDFSSLEESAEAWNERTEEYKDGDIYLNPVFGDLWVVDGEFFCKINDGYEIDIYEPMGFIKVGHVDGISNKKREPFVFDNPQVGDEKP